MKTLLLMLWATQAALAASPVDPSGDWEVRWDRTFAGWHPPVFDGMMHLERTGAAWSGALKFRESDAAFQVVGVRVDGDRVTVEARVQSGEGADTVEIVGWIREDRWLGEMHWGQVVKWTPFGGRRAKLPTLRPGSVDHSLPAGAALDAKQLLLKAAVEHSSAVVIVKDGQIVVEQYRDGYQGGPLMAMSASKSMVSMAVGCLIAEKKLSLDTPVALLFPEWRNGPKAAITIRHLLTHTSGLDPERAAFKTESIIAHAAKSALVFPPGTRFQYNNNAVDFLAAVVQRAAGVPLDEYLESHLFKKLDISGANWMKDLDGTPRGAGELNIRPVDLAKLGQLMLDGGVWHGERLLPREWIDASAAAGQSFEQACGLLWWREGEFAQVLTEPVLAGWRAAGLDAALVARLRPLVGKPFAENSAYFAALKKAAGPDWDAAWATLQKGNHIPLSERVANGPVHGFSARGWLGQFLVVFPATRVVAVRMRELEAADQKSKDEKDGYPGFADDVWRLTR